MSTNTTLEKVGKWGSGGTPLSSNPDFYNGEIPWLIIEDLNDHFVTRSEKSITELGLKNSSAKLVPANTLLIAMYGSIGKLGINKIPVAMNQAIAYCQPYDDVVDLRYLFFFLLHARKTLTGEGRGGTQQNISQEILKTYHIILPKPDEQKRIAAILDKADRLRRQRRFAQTLSDSFLQSVFIKMFGGTMSSWPVERLKKLVEPGDKINYGVVQPGHDTTKGVPIVRVGDFEFSPIRIENLKRIDANIEAQYKRSRLVGDEILIACVGSIGKVALATPNLKGANIVRAVARIRHNTKLVTREFLSTYLESGYAQAYFDKETRTVSQPTLNIEHIENAWIPTPPFPLQEKFAAIVQKFERIRRQQREATRQAEHLFQTLLHRAFSGGL